MDGELKSFDELMDGLVSQQPVSVKRRQAGESFMSQIQERYDGRDLLTFPRATLKADLKTIREHILRQPTFSVEDTKALHFMANVCLQYDIRRTKRKKK